jgi:hypothetical protein
MNHLDQHTEHLPLSLAQCPHCEQSVQWRHVSAYGWHGPTGLAAMMASTVRLVAIAMMEQMRAGDFMR